MNPIDYFKFQAKNLFKDYKTQTPDPVEGPGFYNYHPKYFEVFAIIIDFEFDEENFTLMNAQHIIVQFAGFNKWTDMLNASDDERELGKLIFDNQHKISAEEWGFYIRGLESDNNVTFDAEERVDIFKQVFVEVEGHESYLQDYRLHPEA
jgi:hypothetical protein